MLAIQIFLACVLSFGVGVLYEGERRRRIEELEAWRRFELERRFAEDEDDD